MKRKEKNEYNDWKERNREWKCDRDFDQCIRVVDKRFNFDYIVFASLGFLSYFYPYFDNVFKLMCVSNVECMNLTFMVKKFN